jgi:putative aldouronate transport system permease protein
MITTKHDLPFRTINTVLLVFICITTMAPIIHVIALSFSDAKYLDQNLVTFWPKGPNLNAYRYVFAQSILWRSLGVSIFITSIGTVVALAFITSFAYPLSRPHMRFRKPVIKGVLVTFIFPVPLIPFYLVVKNLGMYNTLWALILPAALSAYYVFITKTFFQGISQELFDAATIDGCGEVGTFVRIALPLSTAVIATIALFHAVNLWNTYFSALIFIQDPRKRPIQIVLRSLVVDDNIDSMTVQTDDAAVAGYTSEQLKAAIIIFGTVPILLFYPFLQKYFVKGAMLGSLKE